MRRTTAKSTERKIKRLFVANRGEIAVRIIEACRKLGVTVTLGVSDADRQTLAAQMADKVICIGPAPSSESYLKAETVVAAAKGAGCDAIHPGYGFLAENPVLPRLCLEHGLTFVGPNTKAIAAMGDKLRARNIAEKLKVPTVPGTEVMQSADDALRFGQKLGYPFLLKASAGGGGRGMRVVRSPLEIQAAFEGASAEADAAFKDPRLYIERYVERARHIEIQVFGDGQGNIVHLGERDCTIQRRHQKLIEETPSPVVDSDLRARMADAALRIARYVSYNNAGTVEFILDMDSNEFHFLEMNTRIQVEHPVTEMVTGIDLVAEQIRVAGGAPLSFSQQDIRPNGHAIECRINAEVPERGFAPCPGQITVWKPPAGTGVRVDSHCYQGYFVPPFYDSLLAKLIVHGHDRDAAVQRMIRALDDFVVEGVPTTIGFHRAALTHTDFGAGRVTTRWVEEKFLAKPFKAERAA